MEYEGLLMSGEEIGKPLMMNKKTMKIKSYEENLNQDENQEEISWETMTRYMTSSDEDQENYEEENS